MAIYRYQHGDRPLDGYTIQHGLGRGGFGEVYYAVSDAGREVALKAVQNYEDIELRGIKHCMNLKHPQLVSIFDIKHTEQDLPFVVMEYIDGPSLRDILDSHPDGLGPAKSAFFLKEIAKGLSYLHDCGVVHRDLKPHNVFYEQGVVKIGDYSLSKAITTSHRSGHTVTVGTVHYMAPEISVGRYDHTVDIYALGVMLYEMLKGHPPFLGDSMGEVLMKHVAGEVDVSGIEAPFARVIRKALSKEPHERYESAQEMIDDLMGHSELQQSVASLGPETLTVIAEKAMKSARPEPAPTAIYPANATPPPPNRFRALHDILPKQPIVSREQLHAARDQFRAAKHRIKTAAQDKPTRGSFWLGIFVLACFTGTMVIASGANGHPGPMLPAIVLWVIAIAGWRRWRGESGHSPYVAPPVYPAEAPPNSEPAPAQPAYAAAHPSPVHEPRYTPDASVEPEPESPYSRLVALVMSCVGLLFGVAGLQRIYVGRIKSGLLWLVTFGLFGIGQIYDTVMIALGQFRDLDGNRVLDFTKDRVTTLKQPVNEYSAVVRQRWTESRVGFKLGNLLFNSVGATLLLISLGVGAAMTVDIPGAFASGAFGSDPRVELYDAFGIADWNVIASAVLGIITLATGILAAICLIFARRESNWSHMMRVPVAALAFVGSIACIGTTTSFGNRWHHIGPFVERHQVGHAFRHLFGGDFWPGLIIGSLIFVLGIFILAWPAKRRPVTVETVEHRPQTAERPRESEEVVQ